MKTEIVKKEVIIFDNKEEEEKFLQDYLERKSRIVSAVQKLRILKRDRYLCKECGNSPVYDEKCILEIDHIVPFSKGGKTIDLNLQTLCKTCHKRKTINDKKSR